VSRSWILFLPWKKISNKRARARIRFPSADTPPFFMARSHYSSTVQSSLGDFSYWHAGRNARIREGKNLAPARALHFMRCTLGKERERERKKKQNTLFLTYISLYVIVIIYSLTVYSFIGSSSKWPFKTKSQKHVGFVTWQSCRGSGVKGRWFSLPRRLSSVLWPFVNSNGWMLSLV